MKAFLWRSLLAGVVLVVLAGRPAAAAERLCDPSFENCRTPLIDLINAETVGIDAAWWFMEDSRYANALISRWQAGVPVRVIIDTQANAGYPLNADMLKMVKDAGIPMREKTTGGILHWKMMLFAGQNEVEFSGANYSSNAFVPNEPYTDYVDELIYFTDAPAIVNSFKTKYDDLWTSTTGYANYANITSPLTRVYPTYTIDPEMNLPPGSSSVDFANRSVSRYNAETQQIDAIMYRITDRRHTDALINAMNRGVRVRLISEPEQYRDPTRLWHSWNVDRLYMAMLDATARGLAGGAIKHRAHAGLNHEKMTVLHGLQLAVYGSSNWTSPSANSQAEHNIFTKKLWFFQYGLDHFDRKWNNTTGNIETEDFVPLPPDRPTYVSPANSASNQPTTLTLRWYAGPWAHKYDIYLGTDPNPPLLVGDVELGPSASSTDYVTYTPPTALEEGRQYYWRVVSKTMANVTANGPVWSFVTTGGVAPSLGAGDLNLYAANAPVVQGRWSRLADSTAAGGYRLSNPNAGAPKMTGPLASPADYFELTFNAVAGTPYHLWLRGKATSNSYSNDSAYVQFSGSVSSAGAPIWRIGTTSAATVSIEDCSGCGVAEWGWNDNAYGSVAAPFHFAETGPVTVRVQVREDGLSIDQIMLSPDKFLSASPGATKFDVNIYPENTGGDAGTPPPPPDSSGTLVVYAGKAPALAGAWTTVADSSAAGGAALVLPNAGRAKVTAALASPTDYAELTVGVTAGKAYRLWIRGKATSNLYSNDSVFVQLSGSVDASGNPIYRIGTTAAADVNLEDCGGCGLSAWGWQDNGWGVGVMGPVVYFATSGTQTIRIQNREDGLLIDQVMLSPDAYLNAAPGTLKDDATTYPENLGGAEPPPTEPPPESTNTIVLHAGTSSALVGAWTTTADSGAAEGTAIVLPNAGRAKVTTALADPLDYAELTFTAAATAPYRLWIRGKATGDLYSNDSVYAQFSGSVDASGSPIYRIGTTAAADVNLEDCGGCGLSGWGWQDNGWGVGVMGPLVYFATSGTQTIRIQNREDGLLIDQIVLSPDAYLNASPGSLKDDTTIYPEKTAP